MTRRIARALAGAWLAGCGSLPTTADGVAYLEVRPPAVTTVEIGGTLQFTARALDREGNPLEVAVRWRTPDLTIEVGENTGLVTGISVGTGRVQAVIGDNELVSGFVVVTVQEPPPPGVPGAGR